MDIVKDEFFKVKYYTKWDKLVMKKKEGLYKIINAIKKHKFIASIIATFIMFSTLNMFMIYSFMKILQNV